MIRLATIFSLFACVVLAGGSLASAGVIGLTADDDGDGVLTCDTAWSLAVPDELYIDGIHHDVEAIPGPLDPGHVLGDITTNGDPTLKIFNSIDNDTGLRWTDYHVNISMSIPFVIETTTPFPPAVTSPTDWTAVISQQPILVGTQYVGKIDYYAGTTIGPGGTLDFKYAITFNGSAQFCQELIPTIPEPMTLSLLTSGLAFAVLGLRRRRA